MRYVDLKFLDNADQEPDIEVSDEDIAKAKRLVGLQFKREFLEGYKQDRGERKKYATKVYWIIFVFLIITLGIVTASGIGCLDFHLSDNVLIALLTTTTANVIGVFMIVMRYLFKEKSGNPI